MVTESFNIISRGLDNTMAVLPAILGALIVLLIGWIVGRLLGKAVHILLDKATAAPAIGDSDLGKSVTRSGITIGYLGDIAVRCIVYLIAIFAAVDILNLEYLSRFMTKVVEYIPHAIAFVIILVVGIILTDYFIDMFQLYSRSSKIELLNPVLVLLRLFLYFIVVTLALSQLMLDLTIIYTIITPIAWGLGLGLGASIAIVVWFGMKNRSEEIMNKFMEVISK
ncbi:MAG: hypothetical protein WC593_13115 [Methanoregula sp.]